jgi:hypothetical protein
MVALEGTVTETARLPSELVRAVTNGALSQLIWIHSRPGRPCPVSPSWPPGTALPLTVSVAEAALAASIGARSAGASSRIGRVASQLRIRPCRAGLDFGAVVGRVSTHREPSQNIRSRLRSAARLAHGAPWLCDPASRRVCSCRGDLPGSGGPPHVQVKPTLGKAWNPRVTCTFGPRRMVRYALGPFGPFSRRALVDPPQRTSANDSAPHAAIRAEAPCDDAPVPLDRRHPEPLR